MKRIFDIIFSVCGLLLLSPLLIIIALIIKANDREPDQRQALFWSDDN